MEHQHSCATQRSSQDPLAGCCGRCHSEQADCASVSIGGRLAPAEQVAQEEIRYVAELGYN